MFIDATILLQSIADELKLDSVEELPPWWTGIAERACTAAYQEIVGRLAARGYTKEKIDLWDRGVEYQEKLGCWAALTRAGAYSGYDKETLENLDVRKELDCVIVTINGVWDKPGGDNPGLVVSSGATAEGGMFNFPNPEDPRLGDWLDNW